MSTSDGPSISPQTIADHVDAAAALLALPLAPDHRPGVLHYFGLAASMAERVMAVPLKVGDEPAFVFRPIGPQDLP